uniref:L-galactono-1,4-lactone dehydrogenase n=1 Tax=Euglena gracilis TaxID=3039 RepID=A0A060PS46_EUGGR|nr:L-galactono-1,4-lactone dehydrogenase [Euglena gracilis]
MARNKVMRMLFRAVAPTTAGICLWQVQCNFKSSEVEVWCRSLPPFEPNMEVSNWSSTHSVVAGKYYQPETVEELKDIVTICHATGQKIRPAGAMLSPNGISLSTDAMVSLSRLDKVLEVDPKGQTITVQAGIKVSQVLEELRKHGLTLQNFSSIQDQQMGGWTQVAAHGTGATLPTVEEMIVRMKLVTPSLGELELSEQHEPELFQMAKVGLGCLGIVSEMTLRCIPQHKLLETTYVTDIAGIKKDHEELLRKYRHVRYMWLPRTGKVVVVVSNPHAGGQPLLQKVSEDPTLPMRQLLSKKVGVPAGESEGLSFAQLRDALLDLNPLDTAHVDEVNRAEAEFWQRNSAQRLSDSTEVLGFECGGSQRVLEVAFPIKTPLADIEFMEKVLAVIEARGIPAPAPLEQRWTARSQAPMSPAFSPTPGDPFSWVGIIMYNTPGQDEQGLEKVAKAFKSYCAALEGVHQEYGAVPHWAKVEPCDDPAAAQRLRDRLEARYPIAKFKYMRAQLDPKNILSNDLIERVIGH